MKAVSYGIILPEIKYVLCFVVMLFCCRGFSIDKKIALSSVEPLEITLSESIQMVENNITCTQEYSKDVFFLLRKHYIMLMKDQISSEEYIEFYKKLSERTTDSLLK